MNQVLQNQNRGLGDWLKIVSIDEPWICLPSAFTLESSSTYFSTTKMEATCSSETYVDFQRTTLCYGAGIA
jgi:hypothetical protein